MTQNRSEAERGAERALFLRRTEIFEKIAERRRTVLFLAGCPGGRPWIWIMNQ